MLKYIAIAVLAAIAIVLALAATKPDNFRVERKIQIKAPPEKIAAAISDFHRWSAWSPYENKDPAMKRTFSGAASGKGARYAWDGNSAVGSGSMEILEATPSRISIRLDFLKPMSAHNQAEFLMTAQGDMTEVSWAMTGPAPYFTKIFQVFCNMDRMVGSDFESGLASLKAISEK